MHVLCVAKGTGCASFCYELDNASMWKNPDNALSLGSNSHEYYLPLILLDYIRGGICYVGS